MQYVMLKDICDINMGQSPSSESYNENKKGMPFFQGNADFGERYPIARKWSSAPTKIAEAGDILISVRAPIGAVNYATERCCIGRGLAALTPNKCKASSEFIFWLLKAKHDELNSKGTGSTFKAVGRKVLEEILVPNISLEKQIKYSKNLEEVYLILQSRKMELEKLDELIKSRFVEIFGDPLFNTSRWEEIVLSAATIKIGSGATPKGGKESYQNEGISFIRSMNVHDGRFEYKDLAHITDVQAKQLDNVSVKEGDVFINITGASVARSCIVPKEILPARVNQHVAIIRCDKTKLNPIFANNMFLNERFKKLLLSIGELGGATRQAITKQQLEMLTIILPPLKLQNQFADFVNQVDKSKVAVQKSLDETQLLFDSLMQKYFG